jgi:hypothetical protein
MIGRNGSYLVHPDTAKLFRETIFSDAAPEAQNDINARMSKSADDISRLTRELRSAAKTNKPDRN